MNDDFLNNNICRKAVFMRPERVVEPPSWTGHIPFAFWLTDILRPKCLVELGTHTGNSFSAFCQAVQELDLNCKCFAVDSWEGDYQAGMYGDEIFADLYNYIANNFGSFASLIRSTFDLSVDQFADNSIDILHIDGLHTYEAVKHDFCTWEKKLSTKGVVLFHDTNVRDGDFGVWKLWDEVKNAFPSFEFLHSHGLGVLLKGKTQPPELIWLSDAARNSSKLTADIRSFFATMGRMSALELSAENEKRLLNSFSRLETSHRDIELELENQQKAVRILKEQVENLEKEITGKDALFGSLEIELLRRDQRGKDLEIEVKKRDQELEKFTAALNSLKNHSDNLEQEVLGRDLDLEEFKNIIKSLKEHIDNLEQEIELRDLNLEEFKNTIRYLKDHSDSLEQEIELRDQNIKEQLEVIGESQRTTARLEVKIKKVSEEKERDQVQSSFQLNAAQAEILSTQKQVLALQKSKQCLVLKNRDLAEKVSSLLAKNSHLEKYLAFTKTEKESAPMQLNKTVSRDDISIVNKSGLFCCKFCQDQCPGIIFSTEQEAITHYLAKGSFAGLCPHPCFDPEFYLQANPDVSKTGVNPLVHYLNQGYRENRNPHPLFDTSFYYTQVPDLAATTFNPLLHYMDIGYKDGLDPHPLFNSCFYLNSARNAGIQLETDPLTHYLDVGYKQGICPHPLFDQSFYLEKYPDVEANGINPLVHFILRGGIEHKDPHPMFDSDYYCLQCPNIDFDLILPVVHYLLYGWLEDKNPHPLFKNDFYLKNYPELIQKNTNPLVHYLSSESALSEVDPHPLFNSSYYAENHPEIKEQEGSSNPLLHYLCIGQYKNFQPHPLFDPNYYTQSNSRSMGNQSPLAHYILSDQSARFDPHPLFDQDYYLTASGAYIPSGSSPLEDYLALGWLKNFSPHPLFDPQFYSSGRGDNPGKNVNPLIDFIVSGGQEGKSPHILFDSEFYMSVCPEIKEKNINPLVHYLEHGSSLGINPHPLFDTSFYTELYSEQMRGINPLVHFVQKGLHSLTAKNSPHPLFDCEYYLNKNSDVAAADINPLIHFLTQGFREGRNPHPLFSVQFYQKEQGNSERKDNPLVCYLTCNTETNFSPHPLFDQNFYLKKNPDVEAAGVNPLVHYVCFGNQEKRQPHLLFDSCFYLKENPDVEAAGIDPLLHYVLVGSDEGRSPHQLFDGYLYLQENRADIPPDQTALEHYLQHGAHNSPRPHLFFDPEFYFKNFMGNAAPDKTPLVHYLEQGSAEYADPNQTFYSKYYAAKYKIKENYIEHYLKFSEDNNLDPNPFFCSTFYRNVHNQNSCNDVIHYQELSKSEQCETSPLGVVAKSNNFGEVLSFFRPKKENIDIDFRKIQTVIINSPNDFTFLNGNERISLSADSKNFKSRFKKLCSNKAIIFRNKTQTVLPGFEEELQNALEYFPQAALIGSQVFQSNGLLASAGAIIWNNGSIWRYGFNEDWSQPCFNYARNVDCVLDGPVLASAALLEHVNWTEADNIFLNLSLAAKRCSKQILYWPFARAVEHASKKRCSKINLETKLADNWRYRLPEGSDADIAKDPDSCFRALVIDELPPQPDKDSGSITALEMIKSLVRLGIKVTFFARCDHLKVSDYSKDLQKIGVEVLYFPFFDSVESVLKNQTCFFDFVVMFRLSIGSNIIDTVQKITPRSKIIYHTIDLHFLREMREADVLQNNKIYNSIKDKELSVIAKSDCSIVVSDFEKKELKKILPATKIVNFPYVIEPKKIVNSFKERDGFMFLGGFPYYPNVDAVKYFAQEIFPLVLAKLPDVKFYAVGNEPPEELKKLESDNFIVTGYVKDLSTYFSKCLFSISPLRYGAGIKGKVVMSMSYGVPCIASSIAAEGMGVKNGKNILIADKPSEFAEQIIRLCSDSKQWKKLSANAHSFIKNNYSQKQADITVRDILSLLPEKSHSNLFKVKS